MRPTAQTRRPGSQCLASPPVPLSTLWRGETSAHVRADVPRACARGQCVVCGCVEWRRLTPLLNHAGRSIPHSAFALTHFVPRAGAPCSPLPAACSLVALPIAREVNHLSLHRRVADLRQCDGDHHEVVAALLHPATVRPATTGRPEARLLRGAALRACHGCEVRSGHATRKSAYGIELSPVWLKC